MKKHKLFIILSLAILSVYTLNRLGSIPVADATDATGVTPKQMAPGVAGGLQVKLLNTQTMKPSAAQLLEIQAGTFTSDPAYVCPANPQCGTPNASLAGTASCPDVCYVTIIQAGGNPPSSNPYLYNQCPAGYAALAVGSSDLFYLFSPVSNITPVTQAQMTALQGISYTCAPNPAINFTMCPANAIYQQGNYYSLGAALWQVTSAGCTSSAGGISNCNWGVSCGVSNNWKVTLEVINCSRPAGYYPIAGLFGSGNQMVPLSTICGLVNTQWKNG